MLILDLVGPLLLFGLDLIAPRGLLRLFVLGFVGSF
jgi:hypothetical protein